MKKFLSLMIAMVFSAVLFCGCSEEEDISNMKEEDMPYGSTMRQTSSHDIDMLFDRRFFTDEEMNKLADYYYSVQTKDTELFESTQPKYYIDYLKENSGQEVSDFINEVSEDTVAALGESYKFISIEATNCGGRNADTNIDDIITMLNGIYEENGAEKSFEETLTDVKFALLDLTASPDGESNEYSYTDKIIYIFDCEDGIYIIN
ncbi:hypothetical protein [Porcipelethomonas sp.]|uniref:hypothetical protein n=1 Tax=Porcipelethomonas sp. TaxID=2981675 RepID=UPI003EF9BC2B